MKRNRPISIWQRISHHFLWLLFFALILLALVYSLYQGDDQAYWDGAVGNGLATLVGIIAGVPIALEIERRRLSREEQERVVENRDRTTKVALLIKNELVYNSNRLAERFNQKDSLPLYPLKSDLWSALSDSGEIRWLDNPTVLDTISTAYHFVRLVASIEDKCYQAIRGINPHYPDGTLASQHLLEDARKFDAKLADSISTAIKAIDEVVEIHHTS